MKIEMTASLLGRLKEIGLYPKGSAWVRGLYIEKLARSCSCRKNTLDPGSYREGDPAGSRTEIQVRGTERTGQVLMASRQ